MPVFPTFEVYHDTDDVWIPINDYVIGEAVFTEGRDISSLGGALPTIAASTLTLTLSNFYGELDKGQLAGALRIGSKGRLKIGSTLATSLTRFVGRLTKKDSNDGTTYSIELADDIWKFTAGRKNRPIEIADTTISAMFRLVCVELGIEASKVYTDDFGQDKYFLTIPAGSDGLKYIQDLSGGAIWPTVDGGLYLQSGELREKRLISRTYYEPGGKVSGVAIPKVRRIQNTTGIINKIPVQIQVQYPERFALQPMTSELVEEIISLGNTTYFPFNTLTLGAPRFWDRVPETSIWRFRGIPYVNPQVVRIIEQILGGPIAKALSNSKLVGAWTILGLIPARFEDIKPIYKGSVTLTAKFPGLITDGSKLTFAGLIAPAEPFYGDLVGFTFPDNDRAKVLKADTDDASIDGTYTWEYTINIPGVSGLVTFNTTFTISDSGLSFAGNRAFLTFNYEGKTTKTTAGVPAKVEPATRDLSLTGVFYGEQIGEQLSTPATFDITEMTIKQSVDRYGVRERELPLVHRVSTSTPIVEDYEPDPVSVVQAKLAAYNELALFSEPVEVFSAMHTDDAGIISRRLGDKEKLELSSGTYEVFVENMETHFSGANTWQIAYYANEKISSLLPPPNVPTLPDLEPFGIAARWNVRTLEVTITDHTPSEGGTKYTLVTEREDGGKPFADREVSSVLPAPPAAQVATATSSYETSSTLADVQDIYRLTAIRQIDGLEISLLASEFAGTYVPSTEYPDFNVFARWNGERLIVGINELGDRTQDNFGSNEYRIAWYGGVPGQSVVTTNARGGVSYTIQSTFGITSLRITQIATGITKVILAKDFSGIGYTPRAFTTQWTKVSGSSSNYFYYQGWIQDHPSSVGGLAYKVAFEDVNGLQLTWEARVVSDSTGRATPGIVGHTAAISVMIITRYIDGYTVRFPFPNVAPPTGGDDLTAYNFTATWSQRSLVLRIQERGASEDLGNTEFRFTSTGLSPNISVTSTTNALGRISYRIPDASSIQSVTATRLGDGDSVTILRKDFYGTYIAPTFRVSITETRTSGSPDRYNYNISIFDAAGVNSPTGYRIEGTFAKFRVYINQATSANVSGTWKTIVATSRHSQGFSNITVTRLTDNTVISIDRPNFNIKASNNPQFSVVVDETNDGTRQGIQLYSYSVLITDPSSTVGGSIYYKVQYVQGGTTLDAPEVQTAANGEITSRFGTERTTASRVIVTRLWDGRQITIPRSSFDRE